MAVFGNNNNNHHNHKCGCGDDDYNTLKFNIPQNRLAELLHTLKQSLNLKGKELKSRNVLTLLHSG